jgi:choline monooxygenase
MPRALLHPADFTSPHRYEEELARIFERSWVHVADVTDVPEPGDYVPGAIGRTPVLVMRGDDGVVRGFLNACPHRGATLAEARGRCDKQLRCAYHGWSFAADGGLRGVPHREEFEADLGSRDLYGVRTAILGPMVFACLDPAAPPFEAWAGDLIPAFARTGIARWEQAFEKRYEVATNWKVYVQNGLEGYHIPVVHDVLRDLLDLGSGQNTFETHGSYTDVAPSAILVPPGGDPEARIRFGHLFPNLVPVLTPVDFSYLRIDPTGPESVRLVGRGFDSGVAGVGVPREFRAGAFDATARQDNAVVERVQRGLRARGLPPAVHSELREARVTHFETMVAAAMERP